MSKIYRHRAALAIGFTGVMSAEKGWLAENGLAWVMIVIVFLFFVALLGHARVEWSEYVKRFASDAAEMEQDARRRQFEDAP